jgi:diguanylate cyclase
MQAAKMATEERVADIATTIAVTMRQMGVVGLPRNYEIFYEALTGSNHALGLELVSLGHRPTQEQLDLLGQKYFAQHHGQLIVENAREVVARELEEIARLVRSERCHLEKYGRILDETSSGLSNRDSMTRDLLHKIVGVIEVATKSTIEHGREMVSSLDDKSAELEAVKSKLEEYKKLADTDPLTHIWNRRAFDRRIAEIYGESKGSLFNGLILADIDRFKEINDRYGHPVGDRILQIIADILRTNVRDDVFLARTGGEEFAVIVEGIGEEATFGLADRLREAVRQASFKNIQTGENYGPITVSVGICMASEADGPEDLYAKADRAMYSSKISGRNCVTKYSSLISGKFSKNWLIYRAD